MGQAPDPEVWLVSNGAYWLAEWRIDGKRRTKSLGRKDKTSRRQARVRAREAMRAAIAGERKGTAPRLSEWLDTFINGRDVQDTTKATYRECGTYLRFYFDHDPAIDTITRADAAAWRDELASGRLTAELNECAKADPSWKNGGGRAWRAPKPPTVARHVRTAKLLFREAADRDLIPASPFDRLKGSPPAVAKDWRQVTAGDMALILDACPNEAWRLLFSLCRWAGLRRGEALALRWVDVDWTGNRLRVNATVERETTKRRRRVTPIEPARCPSGLYGTLRGAFDAAPDGETLVCGGLSANNVRRAALGILRRSGVGVYPKPFHSLRKCCETDWAQVYPQHVVCDWLGHGITVSQAHYLRVPAELYELPGATKRFDDEGRNGPGTVPAAVRTDSAK